MAYGVKVKMVQRGEAWEGRLVCHFFLVQQVACAHGHHHSCSPQPLRVQ